MTLQGSATEAINVPSTELDLERWLFSLSDADYQACARGHLGAGVYHDDQGPGMVNVEAIGGNLLVQHYRSVQSGPSAMEMYSTASRRYLFHIVPVACWRHGVSERPSPTGNRAHAPVAAGSKIRARS